ncbi:MAG: YybH family protein [Vicinamibacteria bacterium]
MALRCFRRNVFTVSAALSFWLGSTALFADVRAEIEAANKLFEAAAAKGDGKATAALYTPTGQALPANGEAVSGTEALGKFWQGVFDSGVKGVKLKTLEVEAHGDAAHEVGQYELSDAAGKVLDRGKYVVIWKKDGGRWKLHRDIWTTSLPAASP